MDIKNYSANSLCFIGDAVYTLFVRQYFIENKYQASNKLQYLCNKLNSAKGQMKAFEYLKENDLLKDEELVIFKRGRNSIKHIPKNGDKHSYEVASGLEAIIGYLYLTDENRMDELFKEIFKGVGINE